MDFLSAILRILLFPGARFSGSKFEFVQLAGGLAFARLELCGG
jgi:hypothetical protein